MLASPNTDSGTHAKAEFSFEDGVIQPHREYLYGYSRTGEHYIVGRKGSRTRLLGPASQLWKLRESKSRHLC